MKLQHFIALGIIVALVVWLLLPHERNNPADQYEVVQEDPVVRAVPANSDDPVETGDFTVRVASINQESYLQRVRVRGVTEAKRLVEVRAETSGRVVATPVERGARVKAGDVLCELAVDTRETDLQEARSRQAEAMIEYEGALDLQEQGLASRAQIAQLKSAVDSAIAATERAELALSRTRITAPFSGIMERRDIEVGDLMDIGGTCATLLDDDPMLLVGIMTEENVTHVAPGADVSATLITGETVTGTLTYIARAPAQDARGYPIEVEIKQAGFPIRQGITAEIFVTASEIQAHLIPPSALTLNDEGTTGVKLVDENNTVQFAEVVIVGESTGFNPGFWVTGLPPRARVVTLGQEIVFPGQQVETAPTIGGVSANN